ncbi:hypothetical protein [Reticulibacter mediterranei]|uniref:hypothetical protein n=1 Tax=Reticulibacter mediterranei TaxID=2778369 RepID=UPI001C6883D7|nr:hypothetical protein [Reticulibacter mediterranei]
MKNPEDGGRKEYPTQGASVPARHERGSCLPSGQSDGGRWYAHLDTLMLKQLYARAPMHATAPVLPEERFTPDAERMQEHTHLARLRGLGAIPLTLVAEWTRAATANTGPIHHTQAPISFSMLLMGKKRLPNWTILRVAQRGCKAEQ